MNTYITKSVKFNLDDAHQRTMYEWCMEQSNNFSGFVKDILFVHKSGGRAPFEYEGLENINPERDFSSTDPAPVQLSPEPKKILSIF